MNSVIAIDDFRSRHGEPAPRDEFQQHWFAVHTCSRHEKAASEQLTCREIETFLPLHRSIRRWRNGDHEVSFPLFPGYTFVRIAPRDRLQVLKVPGVVRLVGFSGTPAPLEDHEIEGLRRALAVGVKASPHPYLNIGRRARITAGPLAGCEGILERLKSSAEVVLSIDMIQRSILVYVDVLCIEPCA